VSRTLGIMSIAFAVVLAAFIGLRMSSEAVAVVVGVVCGAAAGIPMSLLILSVSKHRDHSAEDVYSSPIATQQKGYPPVVVIQGGVPTGQMLMPPYAGAAPVLMQAAPRRFRIVGEGEE
jgi:hypothetical protein